MSKYTLADYYRAAGVEDSIPFAEDLEMQYEPWPHQVTGLNQSLVHNRYGLFDEPGIGKSLVMQAWVMFYAHYGNKVCVMMPPTLVEQFSGTFEENFKGSEKVFVKHLLTGGPKVRDRLYEEWFTEEWPDILLMSYQLFAKEHRVFIKAGYKVLCCDEAHALKNTSATISKSVARLLGGKMDDSALLLSTGTPVHNTLTDAYGMTKLMSPEIYPTKKNFERRHGVFVRKGSNDPTKKSWMELIGYKDVETLNKNLYKCARRVLKDEVFNLKKPRIDYLHVELSKTHKTLYKKLIKERFLELEEEIIDATTASSLRMKTLQIVTTPQRFSDYKIKNNVLTTVTDTLNSIGIEHQEKCILVANFKGSIEMLMEEYSHLNPAVLYGGTKGPAQVQIDKFVKDNTCRLAIINPVSGGAGVDGFQKVCKYMIYVEPTSVPGLFNQCTERLVRPGQEHVVTVWIVKALATVSPKLISNMLRKTGEAIEVNRDKSTMLAELLGQ